MRDAALKAIVTGLAGVLVGWAGTASMLGPRVSAIEAALMRIEARIDARNGPQEPRK